MEENLKYNFLNIYYNDLINKEYQNEISKKIKNLTLLNSSFNEFKITENPIYKIIPKIVDDVKDLIINTINTKQIKIELKSRNFNLNYKEIYELL